MKRGTDAWHSEFNQRLVKMVCSNALSVQFTQSPSFRQFVEFLERKAKVPSAPTIQKYITSSAKEMQRSVLQDLQPDVKIALSVDTWTTSSNKFSVHGVLGFFIDSEWRLRRVALAFDDVSDDQTSQRITKTIAKAILNCDLSSNTISAITADNGSHFDIQELQRILNGEQHRPNQSKIYWIRCIAHIINLVVVELFNPSGLTSCANDLEQRWQVNEREIDISCEDEESSSPGLYSCVQQVESIFYFYYYSLY